MADRVNQHQQGRYVAAEALTRELARLDARGAHQQHRQDAGRLQEAHHRELQGQQLLGAVAGTAVQVDLGVEAALQPGLGREGPHQRQTADRLGEQGGQLAHLFLAALRSAHHPGPEQAHQHGHQRRQQQRADGQLPVEPHHVAEHHQQLQGRWGGVLNRLVDHLADTVRVLGEAVGEIARGELLQGAELQPLQPGEQPAAQLLAHLQGRVGQQRVLAKLGQLLQQEHREGQANDPQHPVEVAGADGGNELARQPREQRPADHEHEGAQPAGHQAAAMGLQQRQQAPEAGRWGCEHRGKLSALFWRTFPNPSGWISS